MKRLLFLLLLSIGCNPSPPPPIAEACGPNEECVCIAGYERNTAGECVEEIQPPPPPPSATVPSDYVRVERIEPILNGLPGTQVGGLIADTQFMAFAGWRDLDYLVAKCPEVGDVELLELTNNDFLSMTSIGFDLVRESEDTWIPRWQIEGPNRRCNIEPDPPSGPSWCQVTNVRKEVWEEFNTRFTVHLANVLIPRQKAQRCRASLEANGGSPYDSLMGFCDSLKLAQANGFDLEVCR